MDAFLPPRPLRGAHAQTILGHFLRRPGRLRPLRERWETPDGDFLDLDFFSAPGPPLGPDAPVVLLLHGLGGSTEAGYLRETAARLSAAGMRPVGMNMRSSSGEPNRRARLFHAGETGDPRFVLERLADRFPAAPLGALGFSLGGHMLLKLAAEDAALPPAVKAVGSVSSPLLLAPSVRRLERGMGRVYSRWILRSLRRMLRAKAAAGFPLTEEERARGCREPDLAAAFGARTIRTFDAALIAPLHGFRDVDDYYARASCGPGLGRVRVPALILRADDDPFLAPEDLDLPGWVNPALELVRVAHGGHVGFVAHSGDPRRLWMEDAATAWLGRRLR